MPKEWPTVRPTGEIKRMLLVSFHGGPAGKNNIHAYSKAGETLSTKALADPGPGALSEVRSMVEANGFLYVANGGKRTSDMLCYQRNGNASAMGKPPSDALFELKATLIGSTLNEGMFTTAIAHPFGIAFAGSTTCYVSNQDTNVVAQVALSNGGQAGTLGTGSQSAYLTTLFPKGTFLDGTFVASQDGKLPGVAVVAQNVAGSNGGLGVTCTCDAANSKHKKVRHSVRDVAIANGILFVCDEVDQKIKLYNLNDGTLLSATGKLDGKPTHLAIEKEGLYVSAGSLLFWAALPLPDGPSSPRLTLARVTITPPTTNDTIGGISFDENTLYVPFQAGTGGEGADKAGGSVWTYTVTQSGSAARPSQIPSASSARTA